MTYDIDLMKEILHKIGTYDNIFDYNVNDRVKIEADLQDENIMIICQICIHGICYLHYQEQWDFIIIL